MNTNTPNGATAGVPGFNEYGYVGGLRVWKKITRNGSTFEHRVYIHAGPNLIAEYNAGVAASTPVQEYVYADQIDSLVMIHRSNNQRLGVTRNRQWSVVGLHDLANGNIVERYAYDISGKRTIYAPDGTTVRTTSSFGNHFGYTNRWHDEESGLINFRARHYNPLTGEFLSRDPMGFTDGMSLYRGYMDIGFVDPYGLMVFSDPWHHLLPWEFLDYYLAAGIDINRPEFGWILKGAHPENLTATINGRWRKFFLDHAGRYPTREEILHFHYNDKELQRARQMEIANNKDGAPTRRFPRERTRELSEATRSRIKDLPLGAKLEDLLVSPEFLAKAPPFSDPAMSHVAFLARKRREFVDDAIKNGRQPGGRTQRLPKGWADRVEDLLKLTSLIGLGVFGAKTANGQVLAQAEADKVMGAVRALMGEDNVSQRNLKAAALFEKIQEYQNELERNGMPGIPDNYMLAIARELTIMNFPYLPAQEPEALDPGKGPDLGQKGTGNCP